MALAGANLVKTAISEEVTTEELGGSSVHCYESGVADMEVENDEEALKNIRQYLSFFPQNYCGKAASEGRSSPRARADLRRDPHSFASRRQKAL